MDNELQVKIKQAFAILENISVRGGDVEYMCAARRELDEAYRMAADKEESDG